MPLNQTSIANVLAKTTISSADKKALLVVFNSMADDIEQLRSAFAALLAKADTANLAGLGNNNAATIGATVATKAAMNVKKT